ncbi:MurR/RpiR family transcriptional regulator [Clostridium sp. CM028]|uniref:MurR/RpiR family transcriptional regulator n=1 Tax=Clostridium sp. CM028 TaxID=2851575 RepID=UPI001C6E633E|nr:MurR/RpiR family transcriptional regulator [Clostridium sp. CM028]MBW9149011.1 MurR/RpiR family transcriptional regulator [Clostridium sp. CM028]WLC62893.1 MurR/RpiR family transcriptional regulator [Clostridium sp. CM028]
MNLDISKMVDKYQLSGTDENILIYIINNIENVKEIGVRGIAKENYTSTTTIMNLAKKIGYSGFLDMYYNLNFTLKDKKSHFSGQKNNKYYGVDLDELLSLIESKKISDFIDLLMENKGQIIYTCGQGFSESIAKYITRKLLVLGFNCIFSESYESYDVNAIKAKLFISVSKSGETDFLVKVSESAKKNGIKIVSFTGDVDNTLAKISDINFKLYDMNTMDDRNKLATSFYSNILILFEFLIGIYLEKSQEN